MEDQYLYFDIDGTLLHSLGAGSAALARAFRETFREPNFEGIVIHGSTDRGIAEQIFRAHGIEDTNENWHTFRETYLEHLPDTLAERDGAVLPGVIDLLERLKEFAHLKLGVLTGNCQQGAALKLRHYELEAYFSFGAYGDDHHDRADIARSAWKELEEGTTGLNRESVWIIGDTPNDIRCGQAIGARTVAVTTGSFSADELAACQPHALLSGLDDHSWVEHLVE